MIKPLKILTIGLMLIISGNLFGQQPANKSGNSYDSLLARKVGADEYGMKTYYFVFLRKGPRTLSDSTERMKIQMGHLKNILRLADENKMVMAGPFIDDQDIRGIFIFDASSREEVEEWLKSDPAVKAGLLATEIHPWYGSAALMELGSLHKSIQKHSIVD
jgi:uncharacterized protein